MKMFLIFLLCLLPCLSCMPGSGNTSPSSVQVSASVESGKGTDQETRRENDLALHKAGKTKAKEPEQDLMEPELFALLLLIMVLGMMYTSPSR